MFSTIEIQSIRGLTRKISFEKGVTCLLGANGTGKSTIIESICFAIFGSSMLRGSVSELLDTSSSITLTGDFPQAYVLNRTKKNILLRFATGESLTKAKDVADYFSTLFGHKDVFLNVFVANQGAVAEIASTRAATRRKILVELLGLATLNDAVVDLARSSVGIFTPVMTVEEAQKDLAEVNAVANNVDVTQLSAVIQLRQELAQAVQTPGNILQARQGLQFAEANIPTTTSALAEIQRVITLKRSIRNEISKGAVTQCPICYSTVSHVDILTRLDADLDVLQKQVDKLRADVTYLNDVCNKFRTVAHLRTREEILTGRDHLLAKYPDPTAAWNAATARSGLEEQLRNVTAQWQQYNTLLPTKELAEHLKEFLTHILVKYFNRLKCIVGSYLTAYTKFQEFSLTEEFDMLVDGRGVWTLSGGERDLVCTILRVALAQVVSEARFGCCPIIIFDSAFDSISEVEMLRILEMLRESPFERVIITHHNAQLATKVDINYVQLGAV